MDDELHASLVQFYTDVNAKYPKDIYDLKGEQRTNAKSKFRQIAKPYHVKNGILIHSRDGKEVLPKSRFPDVLAACHNNPVIGGHFSTEKTYLKIVERFYWKGKYGYMLHDRR